MTTSKRRLFIDIETYCEVDLKKSGVYRYADDPSFEVQLFGFAYDDFGDGLGESFADDDDDF